MASRNSESRIGSVLVIGGCGFVGFHIVRHFLLEPSCTSVSVISRTPTSNRLPNVAYHAGDISDLHAIRNLILQMQPSVIVHAACPSAISGTPKDFERVTIRGTSNLLKIAREVASVKAFVFTSSSTMAVGREHVDLDETTDLADTSPHSHRYASTKAEADKMVLEANQPAKQEDRNSLRTACIRLPIVYGERDLVAIPGALAALEKGQTHFQIGNGSNLWDFASADNAANAHVLVTKALLAERSTTSKVDGEAFNITDGERQRFWDFPRLIWKAAGHEVKEAKVWVLPTTVALKIALVLEWLFWVFTLGTKRPSQLGTQQVEYSCFTHTYRIDRAKERLGYVPIQEFEKGINEGVSWLMKEGGWSSGLEKGKHQTNKRP